MATASRVLNGSDRKVAPEYRDRVLAAAVALRYTADVSAQSLRGTSDSIVVIPEDLTTASIGMMVSAMERRAREANAFVAVSSGYATASRQLETVRTLRAMRPRAMVFHSGQGDAAVLGGRLLEELQSYVDDGGRVVTVGHSDLPFESIWFDDFNTGRAVGDYLASTGHRRVGLLTGPQRYNFSERARGCVQAMRETCHTGVEFTFIPCEYRREAAYLAIRELAERNPAQLASLDALACGNDVLAVGALAALRAEGIRVPEQISVTGVDNNEIAMDVTPRLTTAAYPLDLVGTTAIELVLTDSEEPRQIRVTGEMVIRESSRRR